MINNNFDTNRNASNNNNLNSNNFLKTIIITLIQNKIKISLFINA